MTSYGYKQDKISQELSMGTKIFKTSYYTVVRAFSFKKINILTRNDQIYREISSQELFAET
jgi:hypothetical protein